MFVAMVVTVIHLVLAPHGAAGVGGTVMLAPVTSKTTRVTVTLDVHDRKLRPVHIHGGRCGSFFGLPFGAHLMRGGRASFVVRASLHALTHDGYALDVHMSTASPSWISCANL
ncbi:MAG TPA: hypothetical protein VGU02_16615 [Gaiellaceae bacterium]|nr:hypothetical protein [Gaiellaceae bacterium]